MNPLISVIITTKNRINKIERAINSVLNQNYKNIEIIVVDDASDDGTSNLIRSKYKNIILQINKKSLGGSGARNMGIKLCKGEYVAFLDDDDYFRKDKLKIQLEIFKKHPKSSLIVCNYYSVKRDKTSIVKLSTKISKKYYFKNIFGGTSTYLTSRKLINKVGGFDERLKSAQDWDFALKLSKIGAIIRSKEPLVYYESFNDSERISNSSLNTYKGHRDILLKHGDFMDIKNKRKLFFEVLYHRKLSFNYNKKDFLLILKLLYKTDIIFSIKSLIKYYK